MLPTSISYKYVIAHTWIRPGPHDALRVVRFRLASAVYVWGEANGATKEQMNCPPYQQFPSNKHTGATFCITIAHRMSSMLLNRMLCLYEVIFSRAYMCVWTAVTSRHVGQVSRTGTVAIQIFPILFYFIPCFPFQFSNIIFLLYFSGRVVETGKFVSIGGLALYLELGMEIATATDITMWVVYTQTNISLITSHNMQSTGFLN